MSTKEDLSELQRANTLLRKGYELQKLSVRKVYPNQLALKLRLIEISVDYLTNPLLGYQ
jgi:hypothetical protein